MGTRETEQARGEQRSQITRRQSLQLAGGGMLGLNGVPLLNATDRTEIVVTEDQDGPVRTERVPTEWWERNLKAREVAEQLSKRFRNVNSVDCVARTSGPKEINNHHIPIINVEVRRDATHPVVPDAINGIRVQTTTAKETQLLNCSGTICVNNNSYDPVPGGVAMGQNNGCVGTCSLEVHKDGDAG